jgi:hypothetical protein
MAGRIMFQIQRWRNPSVASRSLIPLTLIVANSALPECSDSERPRFKFSEANRESWRVEKSQRWQRFAAFLFQIQRSWISLFRVSRECIPRVKISDQSS